MPTLLKKILTIIIFVFTFSFLAFLAPSSVQAEPKEFVKAVQEGNNLQWYLGGKSGMLATTADTLFVAIGGAYNEEGNLISAGALQTTSVLIAQLYNKQPASSIDYLAHIINHSGLAKSAYAQGEGWKFLTTTTRGADPDGAGPLLPPEDPVILKIWTVSRNIVYVFFIIIFVAIGFMIMFRSKLNPQTTVNIQLALPNIIVSLILVTFSFAICGFIIDFVFFGHRLIETVFFKPLGKPFYPLIPGGEYYEVASKMDIVSALLYPTSPVAGITSPWAGVNVFGQFIKFFQKGIWDALGSLLGVTTDTTFFGGLIPLILAFTLLGTALKIFFSLITKYVTLILSTIMSPFVFLFTAFPGKGEGISNFLKTMLSAALSFPAITFMFFLSAYFISPDVVIGLNSLPPLNKTGILAPGSGGIGESRVLESLIALGILMATTQVPQAIDQMLGVKPGITGAATPEIGGALRKIPIVGSLLG